MMHMCVGCEHLSFTLSHFLSPTSPSLSLSPSLSCPPTLLPYTPTQMGYDGLFFARNDYDDKNQRLKDNTMEMVWRPSRSLGNASDLFTGVMLFHYGPPPGMCFDIKCADPPIQVPVQWY